MIAVSAGDIKSGLTIDYGEQLEVLSGGSICDTTVTSGGIIKTSGIYGVLTSTVIKEGGVLYTEDRYNHDATLALNFFDGTRAGLISTWVDSGAVINGFLVKDKNYYSRGLNISYAVVSSGMHAKLYDDDQLTNTQILSGGVMDVYHNSHEFDDVTAEKNAVINGFTLLEKNIYSRDLFISSSVVSSGASAFLQCDQNSYVTTIQQGAYLGISGCKPVYYYTSTIDPSLIAFASKTTISGSMTIASAGCANYTSVCNGGSLIIDGTSVTTLLLRQHTGSLYIESGGVVSCTNNAIIDFSVNEQEVDDGFLINNHSLISGDVTYTVTVSADNKNGTYKLARQAQYFDDWKITVAVLYEYSGSVSSFDNNTFYANGNTVKYNDKYYALKLTENNDLYLVISNDHNIDFVDPDEPDNPTTPDPDNPITPDPDDPGNSYIGNPPEISVSKTENTVNPIIVTATFDEFADGKYYSFDQENWYEYNGAITIYSNCTIYFKAVNNASGKYSVSYYDVTNIYKVTATVDITAQKNENNTITVTADFSSDCILYFYSFDNVNWMFYEDSVTISSGQTIYFKGRDQYDGECFAQYAYAALSIAVTSEKQPDSETVLVYADFDENAVVRRYSFDEINWIEYTEPIQVSSDTMIYFYAEDASGQNWNTVSYEVDIEEAVDTTPPKLIITQDSSNGGDLATLIITSPDNDFDYFEWSEDRSNWNSYLDKNINTITIENREQTIYVKGYDTSEIPRCTSTP